jgi:hypothetical protein
MAYRDVTESLRAYRDRILDDLGEARRAADEAAAQASKVRLLEKELLETEGLLAKMGGARKGLPMLDELTIAAPCKASWEEMVGDEHVRFCGQCAKNVYNLSCLPREEAEALLVAREGKMCVRLFKRADGTVLTSDCPVGVKTRRRRRAAVAAVGGGLMAAAAAFGLEQSRHTVVMGTMVGRSTDTTEMLGAPPAMGVAYVPETTPVMGDVAPTATASYRPMTGVTTPKATTQKPPKTPHPTVPMMGSVRTTE